MKTGRIVEIGVVSSTFTLKKGERLWRKVQKGTLP